MFEGFGDTWRGWGRSLSLASVDRPLRLWSDAFITLIAAVSPLWLLATGAATPLTVLLLLVRLGTLVGTARTYERRGPGYWLSPLADLLAWIVVVRGILAPSREWRGRQY
jgi:dolichol-phosphate mannosyltransferase